MSTNFSFLVQSALQEQDKVASHDPSAFRAYKLSMGGNGIEKPVTLIQAIARLGPGLSKAHQAVTRLTEGETVWLHLIGDVDKLRDFGLTVIPH